MFENTRNMHFHLNAVFLLFFVFILTGSLADKKSPERVCITFWQSYMDKDFSECEKYCTDKFIEGELELYQTLDLCLDIVLPLDSERPDKIDMKKVNKDVNVIIDNNTAEVWLEKRPDFRMYLLKEDQTWKVDRIQLPFFDIWFYTWGSDIKVIIVSDTEDISE